MSSRGKTISFLIACLLFFSGSGQGSSFGFFAHRKINHMAVFTLPPPMFSFFRANIEFLSERSVDPDKLAHVVEGEAERHYIDIDHYGEDPFEVMPRRWEDAVEKYTADTLYTYGVLPWHIDRMVGRLSAAFAEADKERILRLSAHLGHYVADACTPLHTTKYYNGFRPEQRGIHSLWETRLPELYAGGYSYFAGRAEYVENTLDIAWKLIEESHSMVEIIYSCYDTIYQSLSHDRIFTHEIRGRAADRQFSMKFCQLLHDCLDGMVEERMLRAVKVTGDLWYTAWILGGQPEL